MSERCSLADELKDEAEDGGEERQEPVLGGSDTVPESAEAEPPRAELADETYNGVDSAETICDTDVVLLDNDPLLQYLRDKKLPQPSHTVSAPARAADVRACDAGSADEWSRVSKPVDATHRWLVRWWHQTLHTLLSVICPCLLAVLPYGALPISWQAGEWDCADASRLHIHRQCQQQQQSSSSVYTDPLPHPPQRAAAVTLRLSLHLHAACLALALLATLITVGRAILGTPSTIVELACYILLVAFCASNWTIAQVSRHCAHIYARTLMHERLCRSLIRFHVRLLLTEPVPAVRALAVIHGLVRVVVLSRCRLVPSGVSLDTPAE